MNLRVVALSVLAAGFIAGVFIAVERFVAAPPADDSAPVQVAKARPEADVPPARLAPAPAASPVAKPEPAVSAPPAPARAAAAVTPPPTPPPTSGQGLPYARENPSPAPAIAKPEEHDAAGQPAATAEPPAAPKPQALTEPPKPRAVAEPAAAPKPQAPPEPAAAEPTTPAKPQVTAEPAKPAGRPEPAVAAAATPAPNAASAPPAATPEPTATPAPQPKQQELASLPPAPTPEPDATPEPPPPPVIAVPTPMPPEKPAIPEAQKDKGVPAKFLFASKKLPTLGQARVYGYYPKGCISGAVELPVNGPTWQVMRLSRNRNWGHPSLIKFLERFAPAAAKATGWHGILVGDLGQPRGGPTPFGHKSHQNGLDVDIWFMPMPNRRLTKQEREKIAASNLVTDDWKKLNEKTWTPQHADFIRVAAEQPDVERVLVNAVIKRELCRLDGKKNAAWMSKVRPWYYHHDHIHVRLKCPADSPQCRAQPPVPDGDGCAASELAFWFSDKVIGPKEPPKPGVKPKPAKQMMLADLPPACRTVLDAPDKNRNVASDGRR